MKRVLAVLTLLAIICYGIWLIPKSSSSSQKVIRDGLKVHSSSCNNQHSITSSSCCYCGSRKKRIQECEFMLNRSVLIHQPPLDAHLQSVPCLLWDEWLFPKAQLRVHPMYSVILTVWNQEKYIDIILTALLNNTRGAWELIIVFDQCRDKSITIVQQMIFLTLNPTLLHVRLIEQETGVGEVTANNIGIRASDPDTKFFILVQDDHVMGTFGWNILLAEPLFIYSDVFSVSARCAHTLWSDSNHSFVGRCSGDINEPLSMSFRERCKFYVRDTGNRGPIILHAARTRQLGYLDEENYMQGSDEHDINFRAYAVHGWVSGFRAIDFESPLEFGGSRQPRKVPQTIEEDAYRTSRIKKRAKELGALVQFRSKKWLTQDTFVILDLNSGSLNLHGYFHGTCDKKTQHSPNRLKLSGLV